MTSPNKSEAKNPGHQLREAASSGNLDEMRRLIQQEGVAVNDRSSFNNTALLYAVLHGKDDCVRFLIDSGADVNIANDTGYTPLICAAKSGDTGAVRMLLGAGAETWHALKEEGGSASKVQRTALFLAKRNQHSQVVGLLESADALLLV